MKIGLFYKLYNKHSNFMPLRSKQCPEDVHMPMARGATAIVLLAVIGTEGHSQKITHCILGNFSFFFCHLLIFSNQLFKKILSGIPSECQTVWTLIRSDDSSGLIWVQTVCQGYQQGTLVNKELRKNKVYIQ